MRVVDEREWLVARVHQLEGELRVLRGTERVASIGTTLRLSPGEVLV